MAVGRLESQPPHTRAAAAGKRVGVCVVSCRVVSPSRIDLAVSELAPSATLQSVGLGRGGGDCNVLAKDERRFSVTPLAT